jgi:hypothetical protein
MWPMPRPERRASVETRRAKRLRVKTVIVPWPRISSGRLTAPYIQRSPSDPMTRQMIRVCCELLDLNRRPFNPVYWFAAGAIAPASGGTRAHRWHVLPVRGLSCRPGGGRSLVFASHPGDIWGGRRDEAIQTTVMPVMLGIRPVNSVEYNLNATILRLARIGPGGYE